MDLPLIAYNGFYFYIADDSFWLLSFINFTKSTCVIYRFFKTAVNVHEVLKFFVSLYQT